MTHEENVVCDIWHVGTDNDQYKQVSGIWDAYSSIQIKLITLARMVVILRFKLFHLIN